MAEDAADARNADRPLEYAPPPPGGRRRRIVRRALIACTLLFGALLLLRYAYVPLHLKVAFLHHQSRCMAFAPPADTVAYTEDVATLTRLTGGGFSGPGWATFSFNSARAAYFLVPKSLQRLEQTPGVDIPQGFGPVFMHARTAAGGAERLVVVKVDQERSWRLNFPAGAPPDHLLAATVVRPATLLSGPAFTRTLWNPPPVPPDFGQITFFAGQPDPADAAHFTVDYQTPAGPGTIDGWLKHDDTIKFQATSGPLAP